MPDVKIRAFQPGDRLALCRICYDCGLMGESIDPLIGSQELFTDYWMSYYLDHEPEATVVAVVDGEPVGYLVGCLDTKRFDRIQQSEIWPRIVRDFFRGKYGFPRQLLPFLWRLVRTQGKDKVLRAPLDQYPAHLHMNVAVGYRQQGYGAQLMDAYLDYLAQRNIRGVHLLTTSKNTIAVPFYERRRFTLHDSAPVSLYRSYLNAPVEGLLYVRDLEGAEGR